MSKIHNTTAMSTPNPEVNQFNCFQGDFSDEFDDDSKKEQWELDIKVLRVCFQIDIVLLFYCYWYDLFKSKSSSSLTKPLSREQLWLLLILVSLYFFSQSTANIWIELGIRISNGEFLFLRRDHSTRKTLTDERRRRW